MQILDTTIVYLMLGSPKSYDAMVRKDEAGNFCILLDLVRICDYSDDVDKLKGIAHFLSHQEDVLSVEWNSIEMQKRR